jgi:putative sterol carrier protein
MLEAAFDAYLAAAVPADPSVEIATPNGLAIGPATMATLLLGEQLIHGLDISRTAQMPWPIAKADALLVFGGAVTVMPQYVRPNRAAGVHVSFELRMRGGASYRLAVDDGTATVTAAGQRADCVITADPVVFLLLGYGRISQFSPVLHGKLRPGGRKPWLAMKFGSLLYSP